MEPLWEHVGTLGESKLWKSARDTQAVPGKTNISRLMVNRGRDRPLDPAKMAELHTQTVRIDPTFRP